jgi:sensor histidine kinase YesM
VEIVLSASLSDDLLLLSLKNQFDPDQQVQGEGIGLKNVRERLRLIYGRHDLLNTRTNPEKNEFVVTVKIPFSNTG